MTIKWIVTDMDGTLLNSADELTERTREALIECQKKGIRLILASGRSYVRLMPYVKMLQMEKYGGSLIEINGLALNHLQEKQRKVLAPLETKDVDVLFPILEDFQVEIQGYEDETLYYWIPEHHIPFKLREIEEKGYSSEHPLVSGTWSWVSDMVHSYPNLIRIYSRQELPEQINKMNCIDEEDRIQEVYDYLTAHLSGKYEFVRTGPRLIEIAPKGVSKGHTLAAFMKEEGVTPEEVMVFGDGENDVTMFECVKYSIAMGNAKDYVKKYAYDVTKSNDENGLVEALEKYGVL